MIEDIYIELPDGSVGSLMAFYEGIMDSSISAEDEGYVLSDGTVLPTPTIAMYNPSADELMALMSAYIVDGSSEDSNVGSDRDSHDGDEDGEDDIPPVTPKKDNTFMWLAIIAISYIVLDKFNFKKTE